MIDVSNIDDPRPRDESHLHTITPVDLGCALIILPDHAKLDNALWDLDDLERLLVFRVGLEEGLQTGGHLVKRLFKLRL